MVTKGKHSAGPVLSPPRRIEGAQLQLLDVEGLVSNPSRKDCCSLAPGQQIVYVGRVGGRLRYGDRGIVQQALRNRAVVDMGTSGVWHLPYHVLGDPFRAA